MDYVECVANTTFWTCISFSMGFCAVYLSPIILPIASIVAVVRYYDNANKIEVADLIEKMA
jgi:hypothetical protein